MIVVSQPINLIIKIRGYRIGTNMYNSISFISHLSSLISDSNATSNFIQPFSIRLIKIHDDNGSSLRRGLSTALICVDVWRWSTISQVLGHCSDNFPSSLDSWQEDQVIVQSNARRALPFVPLCNGSNICTLSLNTKGIAIGRLPTTIYCM